MQTPDAIIILSAGTVPRGSEESTDPAAYRSTSYDEGDASGVLGGYTRVHAAALLAQKYPDAIVVPTGKRDSGPKSHAVIIQHELEALGVPASRTVLEEESVNTLTQLHLALQMAAAHGWHHVVFVTNEYQVPRVRAFMEVTQPDGQPMAQTPPGMTVAYIAAEDVLTEADPSFSATFEAIQSRESYRLRLEAEERGIQQIKDGTYTPLSPEMKLERAV